MSSSSAVKCVRLPQLCIKFDESKLRTTDVEYIHALLTRTRLDMLKNMSSITSYSFHELIDTFMRDELESQKHMDIFREYGYAYDGSKSAVPSLAVPSVSVPSVSVPSVSSVLPPTESIVEPEQASVDEDTSSSKTSAVGKKIPIRRTVKRKAPETAPSVASGSASVNDADITVLSDSVSRLTLADPVTEPVKKTAKKSKKTSATSSSTQSE